MRDTQRILATLDAAQARAVAALDRAVIRRTGVMADHDRYVAEAQAGVDTAIADMADQVSVGLTAQLLDMDVATVCRCVKARRGGPLRPEGREK